MTLITLVWLTALQSRDLSTDTKKRKSPPGNVGVIVENKVKIKWHVLLTTVYMWAYFEPQLYLAWAPVDVRSIAFSVSVCLFVCLIVYPLAHISKTTRQNFTKFLPARRYASAVIAVIVRHSVRLSSIRMCVRPSVRPSVRPTQVGVLLRRLNLG